MSRPHETNNSADDSTEVVFSNLRAPYRRVSRYFEAEPALNHGKLFSDLASEPAFSARVYEESLLAAERPKSLMQLRVTASLIYEETQYTSSSSQMPPESAQTTKEQTLSHSQHDTLCMLCNDSELQPTHKEDGKRSAQELVSLKRQKTTPLSNSNNQTKRTRSRSAAGRLEGSSLRNRCLHRREMRPQRDKWEHSFMKDATGLAASDVVEYMWSHSRDVATQATGIQFLRTIIKGSQTFEDVGHCGGIHATAYAMRDFPKNVCILSLGLRLFKETSITDVNKEIIANHAGLELILSCLEVPLRPRESDVLAEEALKTLAALCANHEVLQSSAGNLKAIEKVLEMARLRKTDMTIQTSCLQVLISLCDEHPKNQNTLRDAHAVSLLLTLLRFHRGAPAIQELAIRCLVILCMEDTATQIDIGNQGGIPDIIDAFSVVWRSDSSVAIVCKCIRYMAFQDVNRARIIASRAIPHLVACIRRQNTSADLLEGALLALGNVTCGEDNSKSLAAKYGATELAVRTLATYEQHDAITEYVCRLLRNISDGRGSAKRSCVKHGAIEAVAIAMQRHASRAGVQRHGAAMLINMMTGAPQLVRATRLDDHLHVVRDIYSLDKETFAQLDHLSKQLMRRPSAFQMLLPQPRHSGISTGQENYDTFSRRTSIASTAYTRTVSTRTQSEYSVSRRGSQNDGCTPEPAVERLGHEEEMEY